MRNLDINRIMTTKPVTVRPEESAVKAAELLESDGIHHLPVVSDGKLVGVVSSSDLLKFFFKGGVAALSVADATVRHMMQGDPVVLDSRSSLSDAATKLSIGGFHALPVVEPDKTLVGIVTTSDLVLHLLAQIPRGDGSIRTEKGSATASRAGSSEIDRVQRELDEAEQRGDKLSDEARALMYLRDQNVLLQNVCQAAELYIRTGHGDHEHTVLIKRLAEARESTSSVML